MIDLPVAQSQPYPTKNPWYDISQYLTPGLTPYLAEQALACADANFVHFTLMLTVDRVHPDLEFNWLTRSLHPSLRVAANAATTGWFSVSGVDYPHRVEIAPSGWIAMPRWPSMGVQLADYQLIALSLTAPRRMP